MNRPLGEVVGIRNSCWASHWDWNLGDSFLVTFGLDMEKAIRRKKLHEMGHKSENWKNRSYTERLDAMAVICQTDDKDGGTEFSFSRVYSVARRK